MVCQSCGAAVAGPGAFCSKCGVQVPGIPMYGGPMRMAAAPRVARHLQTLGILWCVFGAYRAVGGILAALVIAGISMGSRFGDWGGSGFPGFPPHAAWMAALVPVIVIYALITSALSFVTGIGLLRRQPWVRTLAIVMGVLALFKPLLGTGLGIYTLWVLAPAASGVEYDAIADRG